MKKALIIVWETADRICGKRLKWAISTLVAPMERHGHLQLNPDVREKLLAMKGTDQIRAILHAKESSRKSAVFW